ncbi:DAD family-domain-containing protein [Mariannaea sp. PMI_226]|nr:DAD family-domain-containing protein [Mariannaea sp. PMI_226]
MAPKKSAREPTPSAAATTHASTTAPASVPAQAKSKAGGAANWDKVLQNIYDHYMKETPQRTKLIDVFLVFLVAVGALQFLYCVLAGNYPFNAFLSGFSATVGQFVLTISLRIQTTDANKSEFPSVSPERAFADYLVCSLILHFFCVNFVN